MGEVVCIEGNPVWADSDDKGRMDGCCCQDLPAVTNGCCKDETSKTLENSDVVTHRYECVCTCVYFTCACLRTPVTVWVNETEGAFMCTCTGVSQAAWCQPRLWPCKMGECWEIDLGSV